MALLQNVIARGTHAARPAAGSAGVVYAESDTGLCYRDNGTTWDLLTTAPAVSWLTKTSAYTLLTSDTGVLADASGGAFTLTLPTAVGAAARYSIKKKDTSTNAITLATTSSQTIDGASTLTLVSPGSTLDLLSDGSNWYAAGAARGIIGYAEITSGVTTTSTSLVDISGLSVAVTIGARPVRVTGYCPQVLHSVDGGAVQLNVVDVTGATTLNTGNLSVGGAGTSEVMIVLARHAPAAGTRTYKCQWKTSTTGTATLNIASGQPAFLLVEEL